MKIKNILKFTLVVLLVSLVSCVNEENKSEIVASFQGKGYTQKEIEIEAKKLSKEDLMPIYNHFGVSKINIVEKGSKLYSTLGVNNNLTITEYIVSKTSNRIYIAQTLSNKNNFQVIKADFYKNKLSINGSYTFELNDKNEVQLIKENNFGNIIFQKHTPKHNLL